MLIKIVSYFFKFLSKLTYDYLTRFKNRPLMTFEDAEIEADQSFTLHPDHKGEIEYLTKSVTFQSNEDALSDDSRHMLY